MIRRIQEFILSLGHIYIRVVVGAIIIMILGLIFFSLGYYVFGNGIVLIPGTSQYIYASYAQNLEYVISSVNTYSITLSSEPVTITTIHMKMPGYISLEVSSKYSDIVVRFDIIDESSGAVVYSMVLTPGDQEIIPIYSRGDYKINAILLHGAELSSINVKLEVGLIREKTIIIIARWFQLLGLTLVIIGFLTFLFAYKIAYKSAESEYNIPPSTLREEIASQSYLRLFSSSRVVEEEEEY